MIAGSQTTTINKNLTAYPVNDTGSDVVETHSWDFATKHPKDSKARRNLPYYGERTVSEVRASINAIWNRCKHLKYQPGEIINSLSKRIQAEVNAEIANLGYKPTSTHEDLLRVVGNETFCIVSFTSGDAIGANASDAAKLDRNLNITPNDYWDVYCRQPVLRGVCGDQVTFLCKLHRLVGVYANPVGVVVRDSGNQPVQFNQAINPRNHAIVKVSLSPDPSVLSSQARDVRARLKALGKKYEGKLDPNRLTPEEEKYQKEFGKIAKMPGAKESCALGTCYVFSDVTFANIPMEWRSRLDEITEYPRPQYSFVGAKGDDVFRVFFASHYYPDPPGWWEPTGRSVFEVKGFARVSKVGKEPLPEKLAELMKQCKSLPLKP